ncbi:D-isomer specific 2-hydroxyacid dehydrogenase [Bombardia bombarda]|uniref:D-isomer specific 2-hydroxyacid dehydrogenase n=1 Tax=Bombardia bombarda TaxID=252184 RepID=A0AA39XA93_9PEZI|nr:D-isomer specific 2-hydroxyacid dehydrogenase [Bombardia bombarda]
MLKSFSSKMSTPIKIAILDDYQGISEPKFKTLDPAKYELTFFKDTLLPYNHPSTPENAKDELAKRLGPFEVISTMRERTPFPRELVARLPNLRLLLSTGNRNLGLDLEAFKERGIPVAGAEDKGRAGSVGTDSTTEHCVAMILAATRNIAQDDHGVKSGGWQTVPAISLNRRTFGTVGLGRLGVAVAKIMHQAFDMRIVAWSPNLTQEAADEKAKAAGFPVENSQGEKTFKVVSKEELFKTSDVVSIHLVLSDRSRGSISSTDLALMKKSAILVNTSRGPLVVEEDLLDALERGLIRAAALDVFELEPLPLDSKWRTTKWGQDGRSHVLLTPHMGYVEQDTLEGWYEHQVENVQRWEKGEPLEMSLY